MADVARNACPLCGALDEMDVLGKVESGTHGNDSDYYVLRCAACGHEWEQEYA